MSSRSVLLAGYRAVVGPTPTWAEHRAVAAMFFLNGVLFASWASEVPVLRHRLGLSEASLSVALVALTLGSVLVAPLVGRALTHTAPRVLAGAGGLAAALALALTAQMPDLLPLAAVLVGLGMGTGALDIAMNAAGLNLEGRLGRPVLSGLHGAFSVGALAGALAGGWVIGQGVGPGAHLAGVAVLVAVAVGLLFARLPQGRSGVEEAPLPTAGRLRLGWPLLALGLLAFCAAVAEGSVLDWSGVYLRDTVGSGPGQAALGLAGFSLTMTLGRLGGDHLTARFGAARLGRVAAVLAALGLGLALAAGSLPPAVLGFALMGLGVSVLAPLAFSAVGRAAPGHLGAALAFLAAVFNAGYLAGPPIIGTLAHASSLRVALVFVLALALVAALVTRELGGPRLPDPEAAPDPAEVLTGDLASEGVGT